MVNLAEENLREAAAIGDLEIVQTLISRNVNVNSQNSINGWTALHWACKRGYTNIVRFLLANGADTTLRNQKGEKPVDVCENQELRTILTSSHTTDNKSEATQKPINFTTQSTLLNGNQLLETNKTDFAISPHHREMLTTNAEDLVLKVRIAGSHDQDFIEIEIPRWKLTYSNLLTICCGELEVKPSLVERIRKLPDTRLRKDSDVKRLKNFQSLEVVLKTQVGREKLNNCYQSIATCGDQTILY